MVRLLALIVGLSPASVGKNWLLSRLGHRVERTAKVKPILILGRSRLSIAEGARIGALNVFRDLRVEIERNAGIGQLNWFSAAPFLADSSSEPLRGSLILHESATITNRHYFDASGGARVGRFATVAGVRSTFMTHGIDAVSNLMTTESITVGAHSMVGSNVSVVLGAVVPERSIVAMGAVVVRGLVETDSLYAGNPARRKGPIDIGAYGVRPDRQVPARRAE